MDTDRVTITTRKNVTLHLSRLFFVIFFSLWKNISSLASICPSTGELVDPDCTLTGLPTAVRPNVSLTNRGVPDKDASAGGKARIPECASATGSVQ